MPDPSSFSCWRTLYFSAFSRWEQRRYLTQPLAFRLKETEQGYAWSQILLNARLAETGKTFEQYAPIFDQAIEVNAKSMIGLMVPFFALCLPLIFPRRRQPIAVNMVFSLHYYAFVLLLLCVPLLLMELSGLVGGPAIAPRFADNAIGASLVLACAVYLYFAVGPVYGARGPARILQTALLAIATMAIFFGYRFVLMPITLYTT